MIFYTYLKKTTFDDSFCRSTKILRLKQQVPIFKSLGQAIGSLTPLELEEFIFCELFPLDDYKIIEAAVASLEGLNITKLTCGVNDFWHIHHTPCSIIVKKED